MDKKFKKMEFNKRDLKKSVKAAIVIRFILRMLFPLRFDIFCDFINEWEELN